MNHHVSLNTYNTAKVKQSVTRSARIRVFVTRTVSFHPSIPSTTSVRVDAPSWGENLRGHYLQGAEKQTETHVANAVRVLHVQGIFPYTYPHPAQPGSVPMPTLRETNSVVTNYKIEVHIAEQTAVLRPCATSNAIN